MSRRLRTLHPNICCYYNHQLACLLDFCSQFSSYCLRSMLSWNLTAFTFIRNLALLLLQAGDIEINPGPRPIDPNPVICNVCNKKINRGINLEASATYYQEDCEARCHQLCNGLTPSQTRHAKSKNKEIRWKCSQHGNGIARKKRSIAFSAWSNDSKWEPTISLQGRNIPFNSTPRLLGVLLGRSLTFNAHIDKLYLDTASRLQGMKLVSHSTWAWKKSTMKTMCFAYIRTKIDYAAPAWQPWLSNTNMTCLEALRNRALRIVSGQLVSTPLDALRKETNVNSYSTTSKHLILKAREKALRNTDDHPKRIALNAHVPQRLQSRSNWRCKAIELAVALPETLNHRQQINHFTIAPWVVDDSNNCTIHRSTPGISSRVDSIDLKSQMSISYIDNFDADYIIYTDGSATARFLSALIVNHCVIPLLEEMSELTIFACYYMQSQLQSLSSGFQVIPTSLATSWQIGQQNKQQNCHLQQTSQ